MFRFNDELLLNQTDRDLAARTWPSIFFALDHAALRDAFERSNQLAMHTKSRSRMIGLTALLLAISSLLAFPLGPLLAIFTSAQPDAQTVLRAVAIVGGMCGLAAVLLGNMGLLFTPLKRTWLKHRLACERMRQWHAQYLLAHSADAAAAAGDSARVAAYVARRDLEFERFQRNFLEQIESEITRYTSRDAAARVHLQPLRAEEQASFWVDPAWAELLQREPQARARKAHEELLKAYENTRIQGQVQYTNLSLSDAGKFWSSPSRQIGVINQVGGGVVLLAFACNMLALSLIALKVQPVMQVVLGSLSMCFAIIGIGSRSILEAMGPHEELRRFEHYATAISHAYDGFQQGPTPVDKLNAAASLERAATQEMIGFLRTHEKARFII